MKFILTLLFLLLIFLAVPCQAGTTFVNDTLTDTNGVLLQNHTGELGATWTKHISASGTNNYVFNSNTIYTSSTGLNLYYASGIPANANYYVESTGHLYSNAGAIYMCVGRINTSANTMYVLQYNSLANGVSPGIKLQKNVNGVVSYLGIVTYSFTVGQDYTFRLDMQGTTITAYVNGVQQIQVTDTSISAAGRAGVGAESPAITTTTGMHINDINAVVNDTPADAITMTGPTVSTINQPSANFTVALSPVGSITSGNVTVTPSDSSAGGTFTPSTLTLATGTQNATFTYTGASTGTKSISITNDGSLSNPSPLSISIQDKVTITINDSNLIFSPLNWYTNSNVSKITQMSQSYVKTGFTGTSLAMIVDVSSLVAAGVTSNLYPYVSYIIDCGALTTVQLTSSSVIVNLATGLASGNHRIKLWYFRKSTAYDTWNNNPPSYNFTLNGFLVDASSSTIPAFAETSLQPHTMISFGDSITEGFEKSPTTQYTNIIAEGLNSEVGVIGFSGQVWVASSGNPPGVTSTWNNQWDTVARSFSPEPDYVTINEGTNGSVQASEVTAWITSFRVACPHSWLFVMIPFGQFQLTSITNGVNAYLAANPTESKVKIVNLGVDYSYSFLRIAGTYWLSDDGTHPNDLGNGYVGAAALAQIKGFLDATSGSSTANVNMSSMNLSNMSIH